MLYKVVRTFESLDEIQSLSVTIEKAILKVVLSISCDNKYILKRTIGILL